MDSYIFNDKEMKFWQESGEVVNFRSVEEEVATSLTDLSKRQKSNIQDYLPGAKPRPMPSQKTLVNSMQIWLKQDDGSENLIHIQNIDIPLNIGQRVTYLSGGIGEAESATPIKLINHTAKKTWTINSPMEICQKAKFFHISGAKASIFFVLFYALSYFLVYLADGFLRLGLNTWMWSAGLSAFLIFIVYILPLSRKQSKIAKELEHHIGLLVQEVSRFS